MRYLTLLSLLVFCGCASTEKPLENRNGDSITMETKGYHLKIEHKCPAKCTACEKMQLTFKSKKTQKGNTIAGGSAYPPPEESDKFKGFVFQGKLGKYYVLSNGVFQIVDPCGNVQVEEEWELVEE